MPSGWDAFNDAYIKSAGRSGNLFGSPFNPDSAFGANMVPGSQNMNPAPNRNLANAALGGLFGGSTMDMFRDMLKGGRTPTALPGVSSSGSPLTIPGGMRYGDVAPEIQGVPTSTPAGLDPTSVGASMGMSLAPGLIRRLLGGAAGNVAEGGVDVAKTGMDVMGAASGNPMSMVQLPFDAIRDIGFLRRMFR